MKLILGSKSKSRRELISQLGYEVELMSADIDEKAIRSDDYDELPLLLARAKAEALLPQIPKDALLVTSDQVVVWNGQLREKPESNAQAREFLETKHLHPAETHTAIVVTCGSDGKRFEGVDVAKAYYKPIPSYIVDQLIAEGNVMTAAGGFRIEDPVLEPYLDHLEGTKDSVMGLPLEMASRLIKQALQE